MFVTPGSIREELWGEWVSLTAEVRRILGKVPAAWLSGSFFTDKPDPKDIDCVYVVDTDDLSPVMQRADRDAQILQVVAGSQVKSVFNLRVDSYLLEWVPTPYPFTAGAPDTYQTYRGFWDDFWMRMRDADPRTSALPRRGYLEVMIDGYQ